MDTRAALDADGRELHVHSTSSQLQSEASQQRSIEIQTCETSVEQFNGVSDSTVNGQTASRKRR